MFLWIQIRSQSAAPAHASWGKQIVSVMLYLAAVPVAFYRPAASLALIGTVAVIWLLPPKAEVPPQGDDCHSPRPTGVSAENSATSQADKG
jgi:hypothetical protein